MQSSPTGSPKLLEPCFRKIDLPKLMSSVAKYQRAGVPSEKMPFWNGLEDCFKTISTNAKQLKVWNMEDIKKLSTHAAEPDNSPILPPTASVPDNLTPLLDKDTAELTEVNATSFMFQFFFNMYKKFTGLSWSYKKSEGW